MPGRKIGAGDWIVVCDGGKALILENVGDAMFPNLRTRETLENDIIKMDSRNEAPGRVFQSVGAKRSAVEVPDPQTQSEEQFLERLAERLGAAVAAGQAKCIILVAAPRALGVLRAALSPAAREAIRHEIAKDYVKLPVYEIEKLLTTRQDAV